MSKSKLMSKPSFPNKNRAIRPSEIKHNTEKHDFNHQTSRITSSYPLSSWAFLFTQPPQFIPAATAAILPNPTPPAHRPNCLKSAAIKAAVTTSTSAVSMPLMKRASAKPKKKARAGKSDKQEKKADKPSKKQKRYKS